MNTPANTGHGHVLQRPDGMKAKCGGPGLCAQCARDQAALNSPERASTASAISDEQILTKLSHSGVYGFRTEDGRSTMQGRLALVAVRELLALAAPTAQPVGQTPGAVRVYLRRDPLTGEVLRADDPIAAVEPSQPAPILPTADELGRSVAGWTGGVYEHFRGDTGKPEPWLKVSVERLGYGIEAILKDIRPPAPAAPSPWQPISTPPANGVLSLFCDMKATEMRRTFFVDWMVNGQFCGNRSAWATHWMPLPDYPAALAASTKGAA